MPNCKCCGKDSKLIKAHIIPKAWYSLDDPDNRPMKLVADNAQPKRSRIGVYDDKMLCESCESLFEKLDDYATKQLLNSSRHRPHLTARNYYQADNEQILKFVVSILLRSSWSSHEMFSKVMLGRYESLALELVDNAISDDCKFDVIVSEFNADNVPFLGPYTVRDDQVNFWVVSASRFMFWVKVDQRPLPKHFKAISLNTSDSLYSIVRDWHGSKQRASIKDLVQKVTEQHGALW